MTNPKIEKVKTAITKTKSIIADQQSKLRDLEKQKIQLENDEVIAMFRREKLNEDEFAALLRSGREAGPDDSAGQASQSVSSTGDDEISFDNEKEAAQ
jgi:hypothetical protein